MGWFCRNQAVIRTDCPKYCPVGRRWVKSFKECTCKKTMWERWCPWEILISREVDRARQISGAISQTSSKSNNEQFISDHWSSTMAAYQRRRIPALSLVSQTGSTRFPGPQLVPHQATRPGQARPGPLLAPGTGWTSTDENIPCQLRTSVWIALLPEPQPHL